MVSIYELTIIAILYHCKYLWPYFVLLLSGRYRVDCFHFHHFGRACLIRSGHIYQVTAEPISYKPLKSVYSSGVRTLQQSRNGRRDLSPGFDTLSHLIDSVAEAKPWPRAREKTTTTSPDRSRGSARSLERRRVGAAAGPWTKTRRHVGTRERDVWNDGMS